MPATEKQPIEGAVGTVTVIGTLLTGLGVLTAGLPATGGAARILATAAVITAALAVVCALAAQVLTISRRFNPYNLVEVKAWYRRRIETRAYPMLAATVLLILAALLAGAAATVALLGAPPGEPTIAVTQTADPPGQASATTAAAVGDTSVTVDVTFPGLSTGQTATVTLTALGTNRVLARAAATPGPDGTAKISLTAGHIPGAERITMDAAGGVQRCRATFDPAQSRPSLTCR